MPEEYSNPDRIYKVEVHAYKVPTDFPESDGTLVWNNTTMVMVVLEAMGKKGTGYTYSDASAGMLIKNELSEIILGQDPLNIEKIFKDLQNSIRNNGNCGIAFMALSAIDIALWDLKAKIYEVALSDLLGRFTDSIKVYGSGGFTSYSDEQLIKQLGGWSEEGFNQVKMKIGRQPGSDIQRIRKAKEAIGGGCSLFVDANGAYSVKQAIEIAEKFEKFGVEWYEEPVSSDNRRGLQFVREHCPSVSKIAAGEYGYELTYFRDMLMHETVDILQADATRCGGISGFLKAGRLSEAFQVPFSFHCAPSIHLSAALSLPGFFTGEYFYDHVRIEKMFFEGFPEAIGGRLYPDLSREGMGLEFKYRNAEKYKLY